MSDYPNYHENIGGDEPRRVETCDMCSGAILEGEYYYEIFGDIVCEECLEECRHKAEYDPADDDAFWDAVDNAVDDRMEREYNGE